MGAWLPQQLGRLPGVPGVLPLTKWEQPTQVTLELEVKGRAWRRHTGMWKTGRFKPSLVFPVGVEGNSTYASAKPEIWDSSPTLAHHTPSHQVLPSLTPQHLSEHTLSPSVLSNSLGYYKTSSSLYNPIFCAHPQWMTFECPQGTLYALSLQLEATRAPGTQATGGRGSPSDFSDVTCHYWGPSSFPGAAVTNYHKFSGFKQ